MWNFSMVVLDVLMIWFGIWMYKREEGWLRRMWTISIGFWLGSTIFDLIALFGGR